MPRIHPTSTVHPQADLADDVEIGPYVSIGKNVRLEAGVRVLGHAMVDGQTQIGAGSQIFPFASVGLIPQDRKYRGGQTRLIIGRNTVIREQVTIHLGTEGGGGLTRLGDDNLLMVGVHIAHDCQLGDGVVIANGVALGGHVVIDDGVVIGGLAGIHQFVQIGRLAMVGAGSMVSQDIPPFALVQGDRAKLRGVNAVGLKRAEISAETRRQIQTFYRQAMSTSVLSIQSALALLPSASAAPWSDLMVDFFKRSTRGLCQPQRSL